MGMIEWFDVRCDGYRKTGPQKGLVCRYLLLRITGRQAAPLETKCPRCNKLRSWSFTDQLVGAST